MEQQNFADIIRGLNTPEGKKLLAIMKKDGGSAFVQAAAAVKNGDYEGAKKILEPVLENTEAPELAKILGDAHG